MFVKIFENDAYLICSPWMASLQLKQCISYLQALIPDAKIIFHVCQNIWERCISYLSFVALERPRESRLEHNCFKCVAFERDAKCQGTISVAFAKKFWKRCISWRACSSHYQIFFGFSICQTHAKHGKMRALAASHETCKMAKTRTKKRAKRETVSGHVLHTSYLSTIPPIYL